MKINIWCIALTLSDCAQTGIVYNVIISKIIANYLTTSKIKERQQHHLNHDCQNERAGARRRNILKHIHL